MNCTSWKASRIVFDRSPRMRSLTDGGSCFSICGNSLFTASFVSTTFEFGCRMTMSITVRFISPSWNIHAAVLSSSTLSTTVATSSRRTGMPLRNATVMSLNSSAFQSCPVAWMFIVRSLPQSVPTGRFTFHERSASATSLMPIWWAASLSGFAFTRTANFWLPITLTWATPGTIEMR